MSMIYRSWKEKRENPKIVGVREAEGQGHEDDGVAKWYYDV